MGAAELSFVVKAVDQASGTLGHVSGQIDGMQSKGSKLGGMLKGGLAIGAGAAVAGIGALGAVLVSSVKEASAAEDIQAQLNAVLKSTGGIAGVTADAINEHALALSEVTRFEDDAIVSADNILLTFTNIGKNTFPKATEAALDLATAFDMDLNSAAMMVGKALNDPEKGLTALGKAGVTFTEVQKDMIKEMIKVGDTAGAQDLILGELNKQIGGSAEAAGKTAAGQMEIFKNALGNVKEEIGGALLPILTDMAVKFGPGLIEGAKKFADWVVSDLIPALQKIGVWLETNIPKAIAVLKQAWIAEQPTIEIMKDVFQKIGDALGKVWSWMQINVPKAIATLKQAWLDAQPTIEIIKGIFNDIGTALGKVWDWLATKIPEAVTTVQGVFETLGGAIQGVIDWIRTAIADIETAMSKLREFLGIQGGAVAPTGAGAANSAANAAGLALHDQLFHSGGGGAGAGRAAQSGMGGVTININAPGGDPKKVASAAQRGVLQAARSLGYT